ncbi:MAG TPA: TIGR02647 family protein [Gammaproteobacteria bacterium]|jgi:uncharacterized protein (TIGR02647 family)|nr:TIGR02647 family protein [Gammaproteobacteria bacterium]HIL63208.1 TIGR02647 family protein [Porticoccaceae bacterium]|tara:strand:+ start:9685 stop:9927 length:243 start_codon:yes stop_codon:yes gene_type:complete
MYLSTDFLEEMELLNLFDLDSSLGGLKIHHQAGPARIDSAQRLFEKQLITLADGGYLTPLGIEAAEHAQALVSILQARNR